MGCSTNRQHSKDQETAIYASERSLGYWKHKPEIIETVFKKWARDGKINKGQLHTIQDQLKLQELPEKDLKTSEQNTWVSTNNPTKFYANFVSDDKSKLSLNKLILACTAMAGGTRAERASIIFDNLDDDGNGQIGQEQIQVFYDILFSLTH